MSEKWIYEDQLPRDLSNEDYDAWWAFSRVIGGVRMGPPFPLPHVEAVQEPCRYCGAPVWVQSDNGNSICPDCDDLENHMLKDSHEREDALLEITQQN